MQIDIHAPRFDPAGTWFWADRWSVVVQDGYAQWVIKRATFRGAKRAGRRFARKLERAKRIEGR